MHPIDHAPLSRATSPCAVLERELDFGECRRLYVVPSTRVTLEAISCWLASSVPPYIVAPLVRGCRSGQDLLALMNAGDTTVAHRAVIIFSDQLTSAADATLLVERGGRQFYLSALEVIANGKHRYPVRAWIGDGFSSCGAHAEPAAVLRLLDHYLVACDALGQEWLLREAQALRDPAARTSHARIRLRSFQSALMYAFPTAEVPAEIRPIFQRVIEIQRSFSNPKGA